ncbi:MAG: hypothetical protein H6718_21895 [Polyangiaceae bacterium]|nr:hypothetical protein [Polyangiaceae bacterium]
MQIRSILVPTRAHHSGALEHAPKIAGQVRQGFGATEEDDVLFAAGFPALWLLTSGDAVDELEPEALATVEAASVRQLPDGSYAERVAARTQRAAWCLNSNLHNGTWHADAMAAMANAEPLTAEEVRTAVLERAAGRCYLGVFPNSMLLAEAYIGASAALDILLEALRAMQPSQLNGFDSFRFQLLYGLVPILKRVPPDVAAKVKAELSNILAEAGRAGTIEGSSGADLVRTVVEPRVAVESAMSEGAIDPSVAAAVEDDPDFVLKVLRESKPHKFTSASARVAYVVGEPALEYYLSNWKNVKLPAHQTKLVQDFARIGSPLIPQLMLEMAASSKVKALAADWFLANPERGRATLEEHKSGPLAKAASGLLKKLDKAQKSKK